MVFLSDILLHSPNKNKVCLTDDDRSVDKRIVLYKISPETLQLANSFNKSKI